MNLRKEAMRIQNARRSGADMRGGSHEVLGEHIGTIPAVEFYNIRKRYGADAFKDDEFVDWMRRRVLKPEGLAK